MAELKLLSHWHSKVMPKLKANHTILLSLLRTEILQSETAMGLPQCPRSKSDGTEGRCDVNFFCLKILFSKILNFEKHKLQKVECSIKIL